jgi:dienelactone hydrolase
LTRTFAFLFFPTLLAPLAPAQQFNEKEIRIPWAKAAPQGLDAVLVYADLPGKHPLVVMTHGTSRERQNREEVSPWAMLPQATWFARRGWLVLSVVRRGYGTSGGHADYLNHRCPQTDYIDAGEQSAEDLRAAAEYGAALPEVDASRIVAVGVSTGGFATVALTAKPLAGLVAAINFAGGRGSTSDHNVCNPGDLIGAYRYFGKSSRTPMLWIYAENDHYFWPELAQKFDAAFKQSGGLDQFVQAPAIGEDGHSLFRRVSAWSSTVDEFLTARNLSPLAEPLPPPAAPDQPSPPGLSEDGERAFKNYLLSGPHKAFAMSGHGFGLSVAQLAADSAKKKAIDNCKHSAPKGESCKLVSVDGVLLP